MIKAHKKAILKNCKMAFFIIQPFQTIPSTVPTPTSISFCIVPDKNKISYFVN